MEVSYRKHLYMPVAMEVHPVNDNAHGKLEAWAPDSEKMQAELEGNRVQKTLNVSPGNSQSLALAWRLMPGPGATLRSQGRSHSSSAYCEQSTKALHCLAACLSGVRKLSKGTMTLCIMPCPSFASERPAEPTAACGLRACRTRAGSGWTWHLQHMTTST